MVINSQIKYDEMYKGIILDSIPYFIKKAVNKKFKGKKHLPILVNGLINPDSSSSNIEV